eukprot:2256317-Amphidinium_carterae.1
MPRTSASSQHFLIFGVSVSPPMVLPLKWGSISFGFKIKFLRGGEDNVAESVNGGTVSFET